MRTQWATFVAVAVLAGAMVAPTAASASTTEAIADTGGMTLVLGSGVSPLEIAVSLDDIGGVTEVAVGGDSVDGDGEHVVRFSNEVDGTRVSVHAKNHRLAADVKAADLADIVGPHEWAAPLFGSTEDTVVAFEVVDNGGYPELAGATILLKRRDALERYDDLRALLAAQVIGKPHIGIESESPFIDIDLRAGHAEHPRPHVLRLQEPEKPGKPPPARRWWNLPWQCPGSWHFQRH